MPSRSQRHGVQLMALAALSFSVACNDSEIERTCKKLAALGAEHRERDLEKLPPGPSREQARQASEQIGTAAASECPGSLRERRRQQGPAAWKRYVACVDAAPTSEAAGRCDAP
jgi:hypothetical protein